MRQGEVGNRWLAEEEVALLALQLLMLALVGLLVLQVAFIATLLSITTTRRSAGTT